jgi:iron complex transport system ATP-binding protein
MRDGTIVAEGAPADVLTAPRLEAVYGVKVTVERLSGGQTVCAPVYERGS